MSFFQRGSTFDNFFLVGEGIQIPLMAFRWRDNDGPRLNAGFVAL